jgi:hypothetical protein
LPERTILREPIVLRRSYTACAAAHYRYSGPVWPKQKGGPRQIGGDEAAMSAWPAVREGRDCPGGSATTVGPRHLPK